MSKRLFDILCSFGGLLLLAPLLSMIAVLVRLGSSGPILYRGLRTGRFGHPFRIIKFRTMVSDAEQVGGGSTARDDPRITGLGRLLRRYKLDELPQLMNVLIGDMSIVGPRPELPEYTKLYSGDESLILRVRPGITDYASLKYIRLGEILGNDAPDDVYMEKVRPLKNALRVKYVREQSFMSDMKIILRTLTSLVKG